jgi:hypothetical protein
VRFLIPEWILELEVFALETRPLLQEETGTAPILDPDFAEDVEEILKNRKPWNPPA